MSYREHKKAAPKEVRFGILTISDTRTEKTDDTGRLICEMLEEAGHKIVEYRITRDDATKIRVAVKELLKMSQVVITNGGTGITRRDVTAEALSPLISKPLPGFGELFRSLSYEEIGSPSLLSRAFAGTVLDKILFCLPGSPSAAKLAMTQLILPEVGHLVLEASR